MYDAAAREKSLESAGLGDAAREMAMKQARPEAQKKELLAKADFERRQEKTMAEANEKWGGISARGKANQQGEARREELYAEKHRTHGTGTGR